MSRCILFYMREAFPNKNKDAAEKNSEVFVSEWDREILEKGAHGVISKILEDFDGPPDVIVLPETSARPLFYVLRPVFQKLQETGGTQMPRFYFFNTKKPSIALSVEERAKGGFEDEYVTIDSTEELRRLIEEMGYPPNVTEHQLKEAEPEKMKEARDLMKERAHEILDRAPGARIAIVDEYESNGYTVREVRRAFSNPELPAYSIFADYPTQTHAGTTINANREGNPRRHNKAKLTYSDEPAVGVQKNKHEFFEKYTLAIRNSHDPQDLEQQKATLRKELIVVGEKVANTILKEISDKKAA